MRIVSLLSRLTDDSSLARPRFERLIAAARAAGFPVHVRETYRSPERQAYLMVLGRGLTFSATSMHSAGPAVDLVMGDGDLRNPRSRARWIAFRRWVAGFEGGRFRLLGTPERSWDWPHVELAEARSGSDRWRSCCRRPQVSGAITLVA